MKPIVFDLFCGLGGWSEAFIAEGYEAVGFDIEVPALMPIPGKLRKTPEGSWDTARANYNPDHKWDGNKMGESPGKVWSERPANIAAHREKTKGEGYKSAGMNWSDRSKKGQDFTRVAGSGNEISPI